MIPTSRFRWLGFALLSVASLAQVPQGPDQVPGEPNSPQFDLSVPTVVSHSLDSEGGLWAVGKDYKASMTEQGFQFVPFLGETAPRNFPVAFGLPTFRLNGQAMPLRTEAPRREADRFLRDHGSVEEIYELAWGHAEQKFRIASRLAGEIVLSMPVTTELAHSCKDEGHVFTNDLGGVSYSGAFLVDADGVRTALQSHWEAGEMSITVPASLTAQSRFPITIDPVLGTLNGVSADATRSSLRSDVAYEDGTLRWIIVWERIWSATDSDIASKIVSDIGLNVLEGFQWLDASTDNYAHPRVASKRFGSAFLTVMIKGSSAANNRSVWGRMRSANNPGTISPIFAISTGTDECFDVGVGGDPSSSSPTYFLVTWTREFSATDLDIHARLVRSDSTLVGTGPIHINNAATVDRAPSVSKSNGMLANADQRWNVVWERVVGSSVHIIGQRLSWSGGIMGPERDIAANFFPAQNPKVSSPFQSPIGGIGSYVVYTNLVGGTDNLSVGYLNDGFLTQTIGLFGLENRSNTTEFDYAIEAAGCRATLIYSESSSVLSTHLYATTFTHLGVNTWHTTESHVTIAGGSSHNVGGAIASRMSGGGEGVGNLITWTVRPPLIGQDSSLGGVTYEGRAAAGGLLTHPIATEGLQLNVTGDPVLGQPMSINLSNAQNSMVLALGSPIAPFYVCDNLLVGVNLFNNPIFVFAPSISFVVPCDPNLIGATFAVQGADTAGTACGTIRVSDAIWIQLQ